MKKFLCLFFLFYFGYSVTVAQRILPPKNKVQKKIEKKEKRTVDKQPQPEELRWDVHTLPAKSKGFPELSAWHAGTAGIIASDAAEISLFAPSRIGFSRKTELLFRIAEEIFLPNAGLKHAWWGNRRFSLATQHTLFYTYPGLKILQHTGFKDLLSDSLRVNHGLAMRHELLFSWLINPRVFGCPQSASEKILTLNLGSEFYIGFGDTEVEPFDYIHMLYHTQLLDGKVLYYGGLQFDSWWGTRFHYSLNGLYNSVDFKDDYAVEGNLRLTYHVSRHIGLSATCKLVYLDTGDRTKFCCLPLLDLTYLIHPGRGVIKHGLGKRR